MDREYTVLLWWDDASEMWIAEVPGVPGVGAQGLTRDEAIQNAGDGLESILAYLRDEGSEIPDARSYEIARVRVPAPEMVAH